MSDFRSVLTNYIKPYGNGFSMHYNILQPEINYFQHSLGIVAYTNFRKSYFVFSEPLCVNDESLIILIKDFLKEFPSTVFVYISEKLARLLNSEFKLRATQIGIERAINIDKWSVSGKHKQVIRTAINKANENGIKVIENNHEEGIRPLLDNWLKTRTIYNRRIRYIVRDHTQYEQDTRTFCAYNRQGKLLGYIQFNPVYRDGEITGYVPEISGSSMEFKQGLFYVILYHAIEIFKLEGIKIVNLGLAPLILSKEKLFFESGILRRLMRIKGRNFFYNFDGINFTKSRFLSTKTSDEGYIVNIYFAYKKKMPVREIFRLIKLTNFL